MSKSDMGQQEQRTARVAPPEMPWLRLDWISVALILVVAFFVLVPRLGDYGFWDPWEPKFAESAREMSEAGSYFIPIYRGEMRLTKPILVYWGILAGWVLFPAGEFGARIGGVAMAMAALIGLYYAVSRLRGRQAGLLAALVLVTFPQFVFLSRQATTDVYLLTSLGSSLVFLCLGLFGPDRRRDLHFIISYACFSLAVLAKGPILASGVFFTTLAVYAVAQLDVARFWAKDLRRESVRFLSAAVPATALLPAFALSAFLFGTSPRWWGYDEANRAEAAGFRDSVLALFEKWHLPEIVFALAAAGAIYLSVQVLKRGQGRVRLAVAGAGLVVVGLSVAGLFSEPELKIFRSSLLAVVSCVVLLALALRRFVTLPEIWTDLKPWLKPIGRQAALFAIVFIVVAGPWHAVVLYEQADHYFTDFIVKHNINRATETVNKTGDADFYLDILLFALFPWSCLVPIALAALVRWRDRNPFATYNLEAYMMIASAVIFTLFSGSVTKFGHYVSPMLIPMAALIGLTLSWQLQQRNTISVRLSWIVAAMLFLPPMLDIRAENGTRSLLGVFTVKRMVPDDSEPGTYFGLLLLGIAALMLLSVLVQSRVVVGAMLALAVLFAGYLTTVYVPSMDRYKSMKQVCGLWKKHRRANEPLCFNGPLKHGIFFYTEMQVDVVGNRELMEFLAPERPAFCIIEEDRLSPARSAFRQRYSKELFTIGDGHYKYQLVANYPADAHQFSE